MFYFCRLGAHCNCEKDKLWYQSMYMYKYIQSFAKLWNYSELNSQFNLPIGYVSETGDQTCLQQGSVWSGQSAETGPLLFCCTAPGQNLHLTLSTENSYH